MAHRSNIVDGISDDISIAQGLLRRPRIPSRGTSSPRSPSHSLHYTVDGSNEAMRSLGSYDEHDRRAQLRSSNTWTSSSGEVLSDQDDVEDRSPFIQEYNRLAKKHGVRFLEQEDLEVDNVEEYNANMKSGTWFSRNILRRTSSSHSKHRRSFSDLSARVKIKKDILKDKDLQELVRLCGLSRLYLPAEYAAGSLAVPTCFRATAQYLVQHAPLTRGVFRIPGALSVVTALYNHYCTLDEDGEVVAGTVRCPTLPTHIKCDVHDVASAFKKFLSGLPGGIIGSLPLFYALVSIQNQFHSDPELTRTKNSKVRARLIALAIWTLRSQYRRELICSVFGLLSMIGRAAETARREDDRGRPLPTADLMGYLSLGVLFGPLLLGDTLDHYEMRLANPYHGLVVLPSSPHRSRREWHKKSKTSEDNSNLNNHIDKLRVANGVTEMLITHWRDVIRHMKDLKHNKVPDVPSKYPFLRPSASESFALRKPPDWDNDKAAPKAQNVSPTPASRGDRQESAKLSHQPKPQPDDNLVVTKHRNRVRPLSNRLSTSRSMSYLAPTIEEPSNSDLIDFNTPTPSGAQQGSEKRTLSGKKITFDTPTRRSPEGRGSSSSYRKDSPDRNLSKSPPKKSGSPAVEPAQKAKSINSSPKPRSVRESSGGGSISRQGTPGDAECTVSIRLRRVIASEPGRRSSPSVGSGVENRRATPSGDGPEDSPAMIKEMNCTHVYTISDEPNEQGKTVHSEQHTPKATKSPSGETTRSSARRMFKSFSTPKKKSSEHKTPPTEAPTSSKRHSILRRSYKSEGGHTKGNRKSANSGDGASASPKTPQKKYLVESPGSSRLSVKALAARFNTTTESIPPYMHTPNSSPTKGAFDPSSVVSPYTTNPSPARSQRSGKLAKSKPSVFRDPMYVSPAKGSIPRRLLRESVDDRSSLRSTGRSFDGSIESQGPLTKGGVLRKISSLDLGTPSDVPRPLSRVDKSKDLRTFDGHVTASSSIMVLPLSNSPPPPALPYHVHFGAQHAVSSNDICDASRTHSANRASESAQGFHVSLPGPIIPTRSNSVLHSQVRTLQKNLDSRTEQVRQLKQQLENKGTQDIGALSEQLREAKREAQLWKVKADIAEKQIEVMTKLSTGRRILDWTEHSEKPSSLRHSGSRPALRETTRHLSLGMDGAASLQRPTSEESNDTILHELAITGSEFDSWADQVSTDLSSRSLLELDSKLELHISKLALDTDSPKLLDFGDSE